MASTNYATVRDAILNQTAGFKTTYATYYETLFQEEQKIVNVLLMSLGNGTALTASQRATFTDVVAISGTALHAANLTIWTAPADSIILQVLLDITTVSTGASTIDIGYTATSATTTSDTLLDGVSGASLALFDSMNAALDSGANAKAQKAASGKWITADEASGDTTALVGNVIVRYIYA